MNSSIAVAVRDKQLAGPCRCQIGGIVEGRPGVLDRTVIDRLRAGVGMDAAGAQLQQRLLVD